MYNSASVNSKKINLLFAVLISLLTVFSAITIFTSAWGETPADETGYDLWLRYNKLSNSTYREKAEDIFKYIVFPEYNASSNAVVTSAKKELKNGLEGLLDKTLADAGSFTSNGGILIGTKNASEISSFFGSAINNLESEGYMIKSGKISGFNVTVVVGNDANGTLYGAFKLLELVQTMSGIEDIDIIDAPRIQWRVLDQWDNWGGSIERGYAGSSIYKWNNNFNSTQNLKRYKDFARANASVGINTIVINNVNAQIDYIKTENISKVKVLADIFREYGIRIALTVRFDSPIALGGLSKSDPLDGSVIAWWESKFNEVYTAIPDFAGILVKADSEGQPGPSSYGRSHSDGANMFSEILREHNDAIVMWRAFVYGPVASSLSGDIVNQAYEFFKPLDGEFNDNVVVQSKNGPRDFLPREPVAPVFSGMTETNMGLELQITQEYTGQSTHLCYLVPMWKSYFDTDLMITEGNPYTSEGTTLSRVVDGTVFNRKNSLVAGVSNVGEDTNWTRLELAQANWYGFGKLAWNPDEDADYIRDTWIKMTFGNDKDVVNVLGRVLDESWETYEAYTSPYSMGMTFKVDGHFTYDLEFRNGNGTIKIDSIGVGNNRNSTSTGNKMDATAQYSSSLGAIYNNINTCPEELLFWFHHVPYDHVMSNGKKMIENLYQGIKDARNNVMSFKVSFDSLKGKIDSERFNRINVSFLSHYSEALKWETEMLRFISEKSGNSASPVFTNLALNKNAVASEVRNTFTADKAVDGKTSGDSSRWATNQTDEEHFIYVDLGKVTNVNRVDIYWENLSFRYAIETATYLTTLDGLTESDWTIAATGYGNEWSHIMSGVHNTSLLFEDTEARYIRMRTLEKSSSLWNSLYEIEIYGDDFMETAMYLLEKEIFKAITFIPVECTEQSLSALQYAIESAQRLIDTHVDNKELILKAYNRLKSAFDDMKYGDLARNRKARRSTVNGSNHAGLAIDGSGSTYWRPLDSDSSANIVIDFASPQIFDAVKVVWKARPIAYKIEGSNNNSNWTEITTITTLSSVDEITFTAAEYRYIKLTLTNRVAGTEVSLYTLSVFNSTPATEGYATNLSAKYNEIKDVNSHGYTKSSYKYFSETLGVARATIENSNATTQQIDNALFFLSAAFDALIENPISKAALQAKYDEVKDKKSSAYTSVSFKLFKEALDTAKDILDSDDCTQDDVDNALSALTSADEALVKVKKGTSCNSSISQQMPFFIALFTALGASLVIKNRVF